MLDFENSLIREWQLDADRIHMSKDELGMELPQGPTRWEDPEWAAVVQRNVFPHHSDVDWAEYKEWVERGYGDFWFFRDKEEECIVD